MKAIPTEPERLKNFATFFKNYMSIWTIVVAALPIPATLLKFIPTYSSQTKIFSVYTSLLCFLLLAYIFYSRHRIANLMFFNVLRKDQTKKILFDWIPGVLIFLCFSSIFAYHISLNKSVITLQKQPSALAGMEFMIENILNGPHQVNKVPDLDSLFARTEKWRIKMEPGREQYKSSSEYYLDTTDLNSIPYQWSLFLFYLAFFILAESSFILMALKEYLQDLHGFTDQEIIETYIHSEELQPGSSLKQYVSNLWIILPFIVCIVPIIILQLNIPLLANPNFINYNYVSHIPDYSFYHYALSFVLLIAIIMFFLFKTSFKKSIVVRIWGVIGLLFGSLLFIGLVILKIILIEKSSTIYNKIISFYNESNWLDILGLIIFGASLLFLTIGLTPKALNQFYYSRGDKK